MRIRLLVCQPASPILSLYLQDPLHVPDGRLQLAVILLRHVQLGRQLLHLGNQARGEQKEQATSIPLIIVGKLPTPHLLEVPDTALLSPGVVEGLLLQVEVLQLDLLQLRRLGLQLPLKHRAVTRLQAPHLGPA